MLEAAVPVPFLRRFSVSAPRRLRKCCVESPDSLAQRSVVVSLTVDTIRATRYVMRASVCHARKIHQDKSTVLVVIKRLKNCLGALVRAASSQFLSVIIFARGSFPVAATSASSSVIMMAVCFVKKWSIKDAFATSPRPSSRATRFIILTPCARR